VDVWKVAEKVFAIGGWEGANIPAFTFKTSELNFEILKDEPGFRAAPYLAARGMMWIQYYNAPLLADDKIKEYLSDSHKLVSLGLSKKKQAEFGLNQLC
jgi:predicted DNA-binding protein (MmcQ/YjbR family)